MHLPGFRSAASLSARRRYAMSPEGRPRPLVFQRSFVIHGRGSAKACFKGETAMAMNVQIAFSRLDGQNRTFVTWRPVDVKLRLMQPPSGVPTVAVTVTAKTTATGGRLLFANQLTSQGATSLNVALPTNGNSVKIWVGGQFPNASRKYGDVTLEVRATGTNQLLGSQPLMVRVRRNADKLFPEERDRFLAAMATLNGAGTGRFTDFRDMHVNGAPSTEAHGGPGFLPWHRAYLLDLERELQAIDPAVTLPYWRFDQTAPNLFTSAFIGVPNAFNQVQFSAGHPFLPWVAANVPGVERGAGVGPQTVPQVRTETQTLQLSGPPNAVFENFAPMQFNPHNPAHTSHQQGWITNPGTAPRDPLFFLLHCNVDRLWAKWQFVNKLHDPANPRAYPAVGPMGPGHRLNDALWPWCGPLPAPRPTTAPGGGLAASPMTGVPPVSPKLRDMIDYLGTAGPSHQAFAYDDVPFLN
jgi:tyrosinase